MRPSKSEVLERERRWAIPAAIATLAAVGFVLAGVVVGTQAVGSGNGDAAFLRVVDHHRTAQMVSSILQAIGTGLLAVSLFYLFRAAQARSIKMRGQLIGVVIVAPLFLAVFDVLVGVSALHAATDFVAKGVAGTSDHANKVASDTLTNAPLQGLATGFALAGRIGFAVAMFYACLHAMRVGLLSRFWGSLGVALGAVSFIFFQFALLWFVYLGILLIGWLRGGRPPAWAAGEAIPWPTPGEKASAALGGGESEPPDGGNGASPEPTQRRKRKQRD